MGQELVNASFGKIHLLYQFFYFGFIKSSLAECLEPSDLESLSSWYDGQIIVLGCNLQRKLKKSKQLLWMLVHLDVRT